MILEKIDSPLDQLNIDGSGNLDDGDALHMPRLNGVKSLNIFCVLLDACGEKRVRR